MQRQPLAYDADFYARKALRLEEDLSHLTAEHSALRQRLRKAEDFEIKYQLVMKQSNGLALENDRLVKELHQARLSEEVLRSQMKDEMSRQNELLNTVNFLSNDLQIWKKKYLDLQRLRKEELELEASKSSFQNIRAKNELIRQFEEREAGLLRQLKVLEDKQEAIRREDSSRSPLKELSNNQDNEVVAKALHLKNLYQSELQQLKACWDSKEKELRQQFQNNVKATRAELGEDYFNKVALLSQEVGQLRKVIEHKNQTIDQQHQSSKESDRLWTDQINNLKQQLRQTELKELEARRRHELQLYELKDHLLKTADLRVDGLEKLKSERIDHLAREVAALNETIGLLKQELEASHLQLEISRQEHENQLQDRNSRIEELNREMRGRESGFQQQYEALHSSMRMIEDKRQSKGLQQVATVCYLDSVIKAHTISLQAKDKEIALLKSEIAQLCKQHSQQLKQVQQRTEQIIRQTNQLRLDEGEKAEKREEETQLALRECKQKLRELQRALAISEEERAQLKLGIENVNNEFKRMKDQLREVDQLLRIERGKSSASIAEIGSVRREKLSEMQRIKADLQVLRKTQMDQLKNGLQVQSDRKSEEIESLKRELLERADKLAVCERRLKEMQVLVDQVQGEDQTSFLKKLAAMQAEVGLTRNLHEAFLRAKEQREGSR